MATTAFHAGSAEHFAALGVSALIAVAMIAVGRSWDRKGARVVEVAFALLLVAQWPVSYWVNLSGGTLVPDNSYPCHFCDFALMSGILALLTHRPFFVELVYFWGLAGTLQGLITPALTMNWPHPRYLLFFIAHSGVVITALYCVAGLRIAPRPRAKWTAFLLLVPFAAVAGTVNVITGANFGFLCRKPDIASLYDYLGPWPWYVGASSLVGLAFFFLLDLPFILQRRRR
jgi:hypothetical integral membrane protein (TIGR02206 family)